jgi:molybdopterin converting factor small subunit
MHIKVAYYGQAQLITGRVQELLEAKPNASVGDVILQLVEKYGDDLAWLLLTKQGKYRRSVILVVNNEVVDPGTAGGLEDDDELCILPAVSGG